MDGPFKTKDIFLFMLLFFQNYPPDLSQCVFVIDQALSVRALQELLSAGTDGAVSIFNHFKYNFLLRLKLFYFSNVYQGSSSTVR